MKNIQLFLIVLFLLFTMLHAFSQANSELKNEELIFLNPSNPTSGANFGFDGFSIGQDFDFVSGSNGELSAGSDLKNSTIGVDGLEIKEFVVDPSRRARYKINEIEFNFTKSGIQAPNIDNWTIGTMVKSDTRVGLLINNVYGDDGLFVDEIFYIGPTVGALSQNRIGIGTSDPKAKLHMAKGDIYLEEVSSGVIMKSPDGNCWRLGVDNTGSPTFTSLTCPS